MFLNRGCEAKIKDVISSFEPDGLLGSEVGSVGIYITSEHFRGSKKMVCPYWVTVS